MLWVCVSISVIIVFNHVQNDYSITDWLTGLYNRRHLDGYLEQMCQRKRSNLLVGIMLDIDNFKSINDNFGHLVGDDALKSAATLLKNARHRSYVARFAGDEFIIILEVQSSDDIQYVIKKLII